MIHKVREGRKTNEQIQKEGDKETVGRTKETRKGNI